MNGTNRWLSLLLALLVGITAQTAWAEGKGQKDLDEALRQKLTAESLRDLNEVIKLLESAIDKGLDVENSDFAESMLVESLMSRAAQLAAVVQSVPLDQLMDAKMQRVRGLAVTDLRRVMEYDNPPPQAKLLLSQLLALPGGDADEALELLNDLFEDEASETLPPKLRAESLTLRATLQEDPEKAIADYNAAIELEPNEPEHRLARADFYRQQKKLDEAVADIQAIIEQKPDEPGAYLMKAQILREQEKLDEALAALEKVAELAPSAAAPYQQRGEIFRVQEEVEKAIEQFSRVLQIQPGNPLALIHRAEAYLASEHYDQALADLQAVLKDNPEMNIAHGLKAQALAGLERLPEAIEEMKKLAEEEPERSEFQMQLAAYFMVNKQARDAIEVYSKLIDEDGENFHALRGRADAYLNIGDHKSAVKDFEKAYELESGDTGLLNNYAWVLATSPDDDVRDGKLAVELATKASEATEYKQAHILSTLAAAYAEQGDFEQARKWSQAAVDLNDPEHQDQLKKELESYEQDKPWRERQTEEGSAGEESKSPEKPSSKPSEPAPATAETPATPVGS